MVGRKKTEILSKQRLFRRLRGGHVSRVSQLILGVITLIADDRPRWKTIAVTNTVKGIGTRAVVVRALDKVFPAIENTTTRMRSYTAWKRNTEISKKTYAVMQIISEALAQLPGAVRQNAQAIVLPPYGQERPKHN